MTDDKQAAALIAGFSDDQVMAFFAKLNERRAEILKKPTPSKPPAEEMGARVITVLEDDRRDLPADAEFEKGLAMLRRVFPKVGAALDAEPDALGRVRSAFRFVSNCGRYGIDRKHSFTFFIDEAKLWLQARNISPYLLRGPDFIAAVLISGDIDYSVPASGRPSWEFGLKIYGGDPRDSGAWRRVISASKFREPISPPPLPTWSMQGR